jgi:hypothetical protein
MFLHSVHSVLLLRVLYSVQLMYYCLRMFIVYETLPLGISPIAVGNKYNNKSGIVQYLLM